jgi:hypothetical protein
MLLGPDAPGSVVTREHARCFFDCCRQQFEQQLVGFLRIFREFSEQRLRFILWGQWERRYGSGRFQFDSQNGRQHRYTFVRRRRHTQAGYEQSSTLVLRQQGDHERRGLSHAMFNRTFNRGSRNTALG